VKRACHFVCIVLLAVWIFACPLVTFAHFEETDGSISVTLHVEPNDNPQPDKKANLYFLFEDTAKKFELNKCNCIVTVNEQGKQIFQKRLTELKSRHFSIWGTYIPFIFPHNDVYHIALTGKPLTNNIFSPFSVSWDFRADPANPGIVDDDAKQSSLSDIQVLIGSWVIGIVVLVLIGWFFKKQVLSGEST